MNRDWANTSDLEDLIAKALANNAEEWILASERRTRTFLAEKERLQGKFRPVFSFVLSEVFVKLLKTMQL